MKWLAIIFLCLVFQGQVYCQSVTDSLVHAFNSEANDSLKVDAAIKLFDQFIDKYPDSLYIIVDKAILIAKEKHFYENFIRLLLRKGQIFERLSNHVASQRLSLHIMKIIDSLQAKLPDSVYYNFLASTNNNLALVYFKTAKYDDAKKYYLESQKLLEEAVEKEPSLNFNSLFTIVNNNLGGIYLQTFDYDQAEVYYLRAFSYLEADDLRGMATILNNLGIIEKDRGNFDKSMDYLTRAIAIERELGRQQGVVQVLNNLGHLLWKMGKITNARDTLIKATRIAETEQLLRSRIIGLELLSGVYEDLGDDKNALLSFRMFKVLYDSLMDQQNLRTITQMELQQRFDEKLRNEQIRRQENDLRRQKRETIYIFSMVSALLLISLLVALYFLQRNKLKRHALVHEKDLLERKGLELENDKLQMQLEYKNKELTTNVMHLARANEFITSLSQKLLKNKLLFKQENQRLIDEMIRELQSFIDIDTWKEFELRFQEVHSDFYIRLNEKFPNLTPNEKKLCAFLRLNMTTKEISAITYQSITSITVARSRLRKKIGVDKEENLISFLESL